ncbi:hypothetical protein HDV62DRAFT_46596 [Trichoderma sp. SZMC 28011]
MRRDTAGEITLDNGHCSSPLLTSQVAALGIKVRYEKDDTSNSFMMTWMALGIEIEEFNYHYKFNFIVIGMLHIATSRYDLFTFTTNINIWLGSVARINLLSPPRCIANQMEMDIITEIRTLLGMQSNWHIIVTHMAYSGHISSAQQFRSLRGSSPYLR